ncbi:MAG TPA: peptidase C15 [Nostocaceae cyanobacterium]|nr:peptidase C15 [Nostocaceae cyanobacterium]
MTKKILLTSFTTWRSHQKSNSSDDLLSEVAKSVQANSAATSQSLTFLRQLPVDIHLASSYAIEQIDRLNPDFIICCGMAEKRPILTLESNASLNNHLIETWVNVDKLTAGLKETNISHDAGKFVCEGLYYSTLKYLRDRNLRSSCVFVHVPIINPTNSDTIKTNFLEIVHRLSDAS